MDIAGSSPSAELLGRNGNNSLVCLPPEMSPAVQGSG
ncbi:hypothetical protein T07_6899, partial [Trichinella nelsoni]